VSLPCPPNLPLQASLLGLVDVAWPVAYQQLWRYISFFNFDIIPWGVATCAVPLLTFYSQLLLSSSFPLFLLLCSVPYPLWLLVSIRKNIEDTSAHRDRLRRQLGLYKRAVFWCFFLVFPSVTRQLLSFFHCKEVGGVEYLVADFSQECSSEEWNSALPVVALFLIFYLMLCPGGLFLHLYRHRRHLQAPQLVLSYGFLYKGYESKYWYWEFIDMLHKVYLTGILQFIPSQDGWSMIAGLMASTTYLLLVLFQQPFILTQDNQFLTLSLSLIWSLLYLGLVSQLSPEMPRPRLHNALLSAALVLWLVSLLYFFVKKLVLFARSAMLSLHQRQQQALVLASSSSTQEMIKDTYGDGGPGPTWQTPPPSSVKEDETEHGVLGTM